MSLLSDAEIVRLINGSPSLAEGLVRPHDWYAKDSPVQAASLDLHVGKIYIPGEDERAAKRPLEEHILGVGETALVTTLETLHLPSTIGAFGFPPARISSRGILMTNPGHIDPGFQGSLRFTIINMGRKPYPIRRGDTVVTVLFARLSRGPVADYQVRNPVTGSPLRFHELERLGKDFLDFRTQATDIARGEVQRAELAIKAWQIGGPVFAAILAAALTWWVGRATPAWEEPLRTLDKRVDAIAARTDVSEISSRLSAMERAHKALLDSLARNQ